MKTFITNIIPRNRAAKFFWFGIVLIAFLVGWKIRGGSEIIPVNNYSTDTVEATIWTCSMHPQIKQPKPGKCPICGMDLIPQKKRSGGDQFLSQLFLSPTAQILAEIETAVVERRFVEQDIRMVGKIEIDETRLAYITAWVPGRIDRLYVNYTGSSVKKGDHLAELYSPELLSTQKELVESVKALQTIGSSTFPEMREAAHQQLLSVRERLRLWGLSKEQIQSIEKKETLSNHITLYSPLRGVVVEKNALEGTYVETGTQIYTIADLSKVWAVMDAYESDLPWLHYGQKIEFTTESYPGDIFKGRIAFIDPLLDHKTRTVKVRVNLDNPDRKLKPEMFVRAVVHSRIAGGGQIMDPGLAGKWICHMHPEVIKDEAGKCDVCGMPLVPAEDLGYVSPNSVAINTPLVIPATAPLLTGKRAIVYVEPPGKAGVYEGREIELGARAGNFYLVKSGLQEGERVVVKGSFKIDSAIQIHAGVSMMNPQAGKVAPLHQNRDKQLKTSTFEMDPLSKKKKVIKRFTGISPKFIHQLDAVYGDYFAIQHALSHDEFNSLGEKSRVFLTDLAAVEMELLLSDAHQAWMDILPDLRISGEQIQKAADLQAARMAFEKLSEAIIFVGKTFGSASHSLLVYYCPMAFNNQGANWMQNKSGTENPYFGSTMFSCGSQTADLNNPQNKQDTGGRSHE